MLHDVCAKRGLGILTKESDRVDVVRQVSIRRMEIDAGGRFNGDFSIPDTPVNTPNILPPSPPETP
jgi:hypothetical protein